MRRMENTKFLQKHTRLKNTPPEIPVLSIGAFGALCNEDGYINGALLVRGPIAGVSAAAEAGELVPIPADAHRPNPRTPSRLQWF